MLVCVFKECILRLGESTLNGFSRVLRKVRMFDYHLVQLISEVICTCRPSMAIINSKKGTPWPVLSLLELWFYNVQDYRNTVLIVISNDTLMSICSIRSHNSISLACELCWFISLYKLHNRWIELILDKVVVLYETSLITFYIMITSRTSCRCPKKDV